MAKPARNYRPDNVGTLTPYLTIKGAAKAIEFYKKAFNAKEGMRMETPDGQIGHADLRIGDSTIYICDEMMGAKSPTTIGGSPVTLHMYVQDCDQTFKQAVSAGAKVKMDLADQFWGDRYGQVEDPFGHLWGISTQKEELTREEVDQRARTAMQQQQR